MFSQRKIEKARYSSQLSSLRPEDFRRCERSRELRDTPYLTHRQLGQRAVEGITERGKEHKSDLFGSIRYFS